jgi:hypothetical protein
VRAEPNRCHRQHDAHHEGDRREQEQAGLSGRQQVRKCVHVSTTRAELVGVDSRYSFTAPWLAFRMRRWKMKNTIATGIVMIAPAASFSGYCVP